MPPSAVPGQATFKDPTSNRLTQFDIAVSLSQNAINNQLRNAWRIWAGVADDNDNDNDFSSFHVQAALPGGAATLDATLGAPVIDLNVASGRPDDIAVSLPLGGGTLTAAGLGTVDLPNTRLAFTASLARRSVALEQLAQIDAASAGKARAAIDGSGLPPGVFSIECLYLDLTAMSALRTLDVVPGKGAVPLSAPVTDALQQTLRTLFGTRQFLLQTVVLPRRPQRRPTFAMTQFVNKVTPYREHPDAASLDYLGVVWNGGPMPADPHHAGDALGRWLDRRG